MVPQSTLLWMSCVQPFLQKVHPRVIITVWWLESKFFLKWETCLVILRSDFSLCDSCHQGARQMQQQMAMPQQQQQQAMGMQQQPQQSTSMQQPQQPMTMHQQSQQPVGVQQQLQQPMGMQQPAQQPQMGMQQQPAQQPQMGMQHMGMRQPQPMGHNQPMMPMTSQSSAAGPSVPGGHYKFVVNLCCSAENLVVVIWSDSLT